MDMLFYLLRLPADGRIVHLLQGFVKATEIKEATMPPKAPMHMPYASTNSVWY